MKLEEMLEKLGKEYQLGTLMLDDNGMCQIVINQVNEIIFENSLDEGFFFIWGIICEIPQEQEQELGIEALKGNLFGIETGNATLGYSLETRSLVLFLKLNEESMDYTRFHNYFKNFLDYYQYWTDKMEQLKTGQTSSKTLIQHLNRYKEQNDLYIFFA